MAASPRMPDESTSSKSSGVQEPHENTPLLESDRETDAAREPAGHSTHQPQDEDSPRPVDGGSTGVSESIAGKPDPDRAADIVGVISVLLLGAYSTLVPSSVCAVSADRGGCLRSNYGAGYRCLH